MPELSDLSIDRTECTKCGAVWLNKQHMWATGGIGNELDLAGLVCNTGSYSECINPKKGQEGGDTWEKRALLIGIRDNNEVISGVFN
jgi:hypothetical protein|tara:strand:- start:15935 stop:16195 length:261 start_codon:yes stop_codon:yes gene_type:complete